MKFNARDAAGFFSRPDPKLAGVLIYGPDTMRIALKRQDLVAALVGPDGDAEMRLSRMSGAEVRRDPAMLSDAVKAQGFFPGQRVVLVDEANDQNAKVAQAVLEDWQAGDAMLVLTAGQLKATSALRKLFEKDPRTAAIAIYADPPGRDEIEAELRRAGLANIGGEAMTALSDLARGLDPGDFRQVLGKLGLYKIGDETELTVADVEACAPATMEAGLDDAIHLVAEGQLRALGPQLQRLSGQGIAPVTLCITATRHFRALHAAASNPQGPEAGLSRARPPVFGPRRDRMARQARHWGARKLETVLGILIETDLGLRSSRPVPAGAMLERAFIRIAMLHGR